MIVPRPDATKFSLNCGHTLTNPHTDAHKAVYAEQRARARAREHIQTTTTTITPQHTRLNAGLTSMNQR